MFAVIRKPVRFRTSSPRDPIPRRAPSAKPRPRSRKRAPHRCTPAPGPPAHPVRGSPRPAAARQPSPEPPGPRRRRDRMRRTARLQRAADGHDQSQEPREEKCEGPLQELRLARHRAFMRPPSSIRCPDLASSQGPAGDHGPRSRRERPAPRRSSPAGSKTRSNEGCPAGVVDRVPVHYRYRPPFGLLRCPLP